MSLVSFRSFLRPVSFVDFLKLLSVLYFLRINEPPSRGKYFNLEEVTTQLPMFFFLQSLCHLGGDLSSVIYMHSGQSHP